MVTTESILQKLSVIIDPDLNKDIVSLGFVKNLKIRETGSVSFDLELTTPGCPVKEEFKSRCESLVLEIAGVTSVTVTLTSQAKTFFNSEHNHNIRGIKNIIAVSSCKGGVGKSTISAMLSQAFVSEGLKVGLLDADIYGPSIPSFFPINQQRLKSEQNEIYPLEIDGIKLMSMGYLVGDTAAIMRGPMVSKYIQQLLFFTRWGDLDYLIIDFPPGTGDIQLTLTQMIQIDGAVIVTTPHILSVTDVYKGILMFEKTKVPVLGMIENMKYSLCGKCGDKHYLFGENSNLSARLGLPTLGELPVDTYYSKFRSQELTAARPHEIDSQFSIILNTAANIHRELGKRKQAGDFPKVTFENHLLKITRGNRVRVIDPFELRTACQCALCVDEFSGKKILDISTIPPDVKPVEITPIGHYAVGISWSDGHQSGIYSFVLIDSLN